MAKQQQDKAFEEEARKPAEKPVSLHPLKFEEALKGLLKVESEKLAATGKQHR